ncbi:hypothetical protein BI330_10770 [Mycobacterium sp. CBMA 623]|nr:hypothetical protein [Mycobacteroides sp. CBMA 326]
MLAVLLAACAPTHPLERTSATASSVPSPASTPPPALSSPIPTSDTPGFDGNFVTASGLACSIGGDFSVDCTGALPGVPPGVVRVRMGAGSGQPAGYYRVLAGGPGVAGARRLEVGQQVTSNRVTCRAESGPITICDNGKQSLTIGTGKTVLRDSGLTLPDGVPRPYDFVVSEVKYDGHGPKGIERMFTVANGLRCSILTYSGGSIACMGQLPGFTGGSGYVSVSNVPGNPSGIGFGTMNPPKDEVKQLPPGDSVYGYGNQGACMALADGGVACGFFGGNKSSGFVASDGRTWTFGI